MNDLKTHQRCYFRENPAKNVAISSSGQRVKHRSSLRLARVYLANVTQQKNQLESIEDLTPDEQKTTLAWGDRLHALPELRRSRKCTRKQWFVCPFDVSALAEIQSKMQKGSPWRFVPPCRYGWNCWRPGCAFAHDQARERQEHARDLAEFWAAAARPRGIAPYIQCLDRIRNRRVFR